MSSSTTAFELLHALDEDYTKRAPASSVLTDFYWGNEKTPQQATTVSIGRYDLPLCREIPHLLFLRSVFGADVP